MEHDLTDEAKFVESDEQAFKNLLVAMYMQQQLIGAALQAHQLAGVRFPDWVGEWYRLSGALISSVHVYKGIAAGGPTEPPADQRAGEWKDE